MLRKIEAKQQKAKERAELEAVKLPIAAMHHEISFDKTFLTPRVEIHYRGPMRARINDRLQRKPR
jgi:hypothetical protein